MELKVIHAGMFKLDGGAMFGVVPKSIWNNVNPADNNNMCSWAMRCLLVIDSNRFVLIDNGMGDKQDKKFFSHYYLHGDQSLDRSLDSVGVHANEITDVFNTHLHFDHCGGGITRNLHNRDIFEPVFRNARYWTNREHWLWATKPNRREKASFLPENILPMEESGHLEFVEIGKSSPFSSFQIIYANGHTEKQMLPVVCYKGYKIVFVADLLPSAGHVPLPYIMSYDTRPLITLKEKETFLNEAEENKYILFFEHDPTIECATLKRTERGIRIDQTFRLEDIV